MMQKTGEQSMGEQSKEPWVLSSCLIAIFFYEIFSRKLQQMFSSLIVTLDRSLINLSVIFGNCEVHQSTSKNTQLNILVIQKWTWLVRLLLQGVRNWEKEAVRMIFSLHLKKCTIKSIKGRIHQGKGWL